jgi:hypothetical protein
MPRSRLAQAAIGAIAVLLIVMTFIWDTADVAPLLAFGFPLLVLVVGVLLSAWRRDPVGAFLLWAIPITVGVIVLDWLIFVPPMIDSSGYFGCDFDECQDEAAVAVTIAWTAYPLLIVWIGLAIVRALARAALGRREASDTPG